MKNTFKKVLTSVISVATIAMSVTGISASAVSWNLYCNPGGPGDAQKYDDLAGFYTSVARSTLREKCTYYSSGTHANGTVAYVWYKPYAIKSDGTRLYICTDKRYHYQSDNSEKTITLDVNVPANSTIYGNYYLANYSGINCTINGYIS